MLYYIQQNPKQVIRFFLFSYSKVAKMAIEIGIEVRGHFEDPTFVLVVKLLQSLN